MPLVRSSILAKYDGSSWRVWGLSGTTGTRVLAQCETIDHSQPGVPTYHLYLLKADGETIKQGTLASRYDAILRDQSECR